MAHSSIGLVGGSKRGSEVGKVGLIPVVLLVESDATVDAVVLLLPFCDVRMSRAVRSSSIWLTNDSRRSSSSWIRYSRNRSLVAAYNDTRKRLIGYPEEF